jgi:hypothetical protein
MNMHKPAIIAALAVITIGALGWAAQAQTDFPDQKKADKDKGEAYDPLTLYAPVVVFPDYPPIANKELGKRDCERKDCSFTVIPNGDPGIDGDPLIESRRKARGSLGAR